ncbi:MAG: insulinase family protein [Bryobacterales bacterium]|nr:insulinase family protein [Bryobacterales bacterium]
MGWICAFLAAASAAPGSAQRIKVSSHTLSNGMKILVHEDHDVPNVAMYLFYKIGSRNERPGTTGLSHYFEHMMFNGARKFGPKQFDIQMEKNGGRNNAYTTPDVTVYTDWFPRTALELMFDMEADRIRDLNFDPKIVESERGVVYSERRSSVDNNPFGLLFEQLNASAFVAHPYQWPVVGWASDIEAWTMDDLRAHFKMGYAPNNCVMVVTGDVTHDEILVLARKYIEPIPRQDPPPPIRTKEPEQIGERRVTLVRPAQLPILMVAYHTPQSTDPDTPALTVLSNLMTNGRSSRLYKRLVDDGQQAVSVQMPDDFSFDPGLMTLIIQVRAGVNPAEVEKAAYEEFGRMAKEGPNPDELQKVRNQFSADFYRGLKTIAGKANTIGRYEVFLGDWNRLNSAVAEIEKVSADDVKRVASKYLTAKNRTVATLIPQSKESAQ